MHYADVFSGISVKGTEKDNVAGAYISGYIEAGGIETAMVIVKDKIAELGWEINEFEKATILRQEDFDESPEGLEYYEQALSDKEVYVIHTYPNDDEE